jgi:hypothetical protein
MLPLHALSQSNSGPRFPVPIAGQPAHEKTLLESSILYPRCSRRLRIFDFGPGFRRTRADTTTAALYPARARRISWQIRSGQLPSLRGQAVHVQRPR